MKDLVDGQGSEAWTSAVFRESEALQGGISGIFVLFRAYFSDEPHDLCEQGSEAWTSAVFRESEALQGGNPYTLHPKPYTLHPTPQTLHPTPYTPNPTPYTLHPKPYTLRSVRGLVTCCLSLARSVRGLGYSGAASRHPPIGIPLHIPPEKLQTLVFKSCRLLLRSVYMP